jgi:outer membrane protein assembly factor BamB
MSDGDQAFTFYKATFRSSFNCDNESVYSIAPLPNGRAWVVSGETAILQVRDKTGTVTRRVDIDSEGQTDISGIALDKDGNVYMTCDDTPCIRKMTAEFANCKFAKTRDNAWGIAMNMEKGEMYACMPDINCVSVFSDEGDLLREFGPEVGPPEQEVLLDKPWAVAVNGNGDVCVIDREKVVILDSTGAVRATYTGPPTTSTPQELASESYLSGICCDKFDNILVSDHNNNCVHLLDRDGHFRQLLLTSSDGLDGPWTIAVDGGGDLWVGDSNGDVKIYSYISSNI